MAIEDHHIYTRIDDTYFEARPCRICWLVMAVTIIAVIITPYAMDYIIDLINSKGK